MTSNFAIYPSLRGKSVFVTGGATGIGAEIVKGFAEQGAKVGFVDLDEDAAGKLITHVSGEVRFLPCDLRDIGALRQAFETLSKELGPATVLVNNAARDDRHDWRDVSPEYWDERQATNLRHQFFAIQAAAPAMIEAGGGAIINMGSCSWMEGMGGMPAYTTAKSAVHGLTRGMATDLGVHGIRVNCVVPGWVMTERQKSLWATPEALEKNLEKQNLKELIEPENLARMVLFLASDDARMCTGQSFVVDAGLL